MSITGTGIVMLLMGLYGLFFNRRFLYDISIFFIPFSATAVINIGVGDSGSAVSPYMFFGALWMLSFFVFRSKQLVHFKVYRREAYTLVMLAAFTVVAMFSLVMPIIIAGSEWGNQSGKLDDMQPIVFTSKNVTQYIYLLFGVVYTICIYIHNKEISNYTHTIKVYIWSVLFVMLWGGLELICFYRGITYPDFIFNNSISPSAGGFSGVLADETKRISSVALEPSILVQSVIIAGPFFLFGVIRKVYVFNKWIDSFCFFLLVLFIIRTTSTGGIIGLAVLFAMSFYYYFKQLSIARKLVLVTATAIIVPVMMIIIYALFQEMIDQILFNKADTYSGLERLSAVLAAWENFKRHPLLGTGWGSAGSFDLFIKLLANCGIFGCLFFTLFIILVLFNQATNHAPPKPQMLKICITIAFVTLVIGNAINGFSFVTGYFWLVSGLAIISVFDKYESINY